MFCGFNLKKWVDEHIPQTYGYSTSWVPKYEQVVMMSTPIWEHDILDDGIDGIVMDKKQDPMVISWIDWKMQCKQRDYFSYMQGQDYIPICGSCAPLNEGESTSCKKISKDDANTKA